MANRASLRTKAKELASWRPKHASYTSSHATDSVVCQDTSSNITASVLSEMPTRIFGSEGEIDLTNNEMVAGAFQADSHQMMSNEQVIEDPSVDSGIVTSVR